jgi:RHS repeat-associated protein
MTTQHQRDTETGLDYRGARFYDCDVARFLSVDPLAVKYPSMSGYMYVGGMPSMAVDPDGRDIVILTHSDRADDPHAEHIVGHQAVQIGNEKDGWLYYSYDADKSGENNDNFSRAIPFASLQEFASSEHNTFKDDYDDGNGKETSHRDYSGAIIQRFEEAFLIPTSKEQDDAMNAAASNVFNTKYSIRSGHQCTTVPEMALQAGGLNDGEDRYPGNNSSWDGVFDENIFPISKHHAIEDLNNGIEIDNLITAPKW